MEELLVIKEQRFIKQFTDYQSNVHRLQEHINALEWTLKRGTNPGYLINKNANLWVYSYFDPINKQDVKISYLIKTNVHLLDIRLVPQE